MIALGGTFKARESRNYKKPERFSLHRQPGNALGGAHQLGNTAAQDNLF
jgi:hypothetical protein